MRPYPLVPTAAVLVLAGALLTGACGSASPEAGTTPAGRSTVVQLAPENVIKARLGRISSGPRISGQLTPAREAMVRAQVGGSIVELTVDRGHAVSEGLVVARIASRDLEATHASAQAAVKSAQTALTVARSEAERTRALVSGGAVAARELEQSENAVAVAEAQLASALARERSAWQQLDDTVVRAPFAGVVSARPASIGDVVAPGSEILTVIDPSSMRLEALVPSDQISDVAPGAAVTFTIRGVPGTFTGTVDRLASQADPVTRQVAVFVSLPNTGGALISGLFGEGRVETASREGVIVPVAAVNETGIAPFATRVRGGVAERVPVTLGVRQAETEEVEVLEGVAAGDVLITGSAMGVAPGTPVAIAE